jgi:hypothetical protein
VQRSIQTAYTATVPAAATALRMGVRHCGVIACSLEEVYAGEVYIIYNREVFKLDRVVPHGSVQI